MNSDERENKFWLTLGIFGELPSKEELEEILGISLTSFNRKDKKSFGQRSVHDVATVRLAEWYSDAKCKEIFPTIILALRSLIPSLNQLEKRYQSLFHLSLTTFREMDFGGVEFPDDFIQILADAKIKFGISIQARYEWGE